MAIAITPDAKPATIPGMIRRRLRRVDRRLRRATALRGSGIVALTLAVGLFVGMAADLAFVLPIGARWTLWALWLGAALAVAVSRLILPLARRTNLTDLAAVAEATHPQLGERLTGAVGLLDSRRPAAGSPDLIAALAEDANSRIKILNPANAVSIGRAARRLGFGVMVLGLILAPSFVKPDPFRTLLVRFVAPWSNLERIGRYIIDLRPGDKILAIGDDLAVTADVRPRFGTAASTDPAVLEWNDESGSVHDAPMIADEKILPGGVRTWRLTMPRVAGSFHYRVVNGASRSRSYTLTAVERPTITALSVQVQPPAYTKLPAVSPRDAARVDAWEGSLVTLALRANKPIARAEIDWPLPEESAPKPEDSADAKLTHVPSYHSGESTDGLNWTFRVNADATGLYAFRLTDEHGIINQPDAVRRVVVKRDRPPTAAFVDDDGPKDARPDDRLPMLLVARDDVAVAAAEIHYAIVRGNSNGAAEEGTVPAALPGLGRKNVKGEAILDLKRLKLRSGDGLSYRVRVLDNRPKPRGPNEAWTEIRGLQIIDAAEPLLTRNAAAERAKLQETLTAIKQKAAENRKGAEQLRYAADAVERGNGKWDADRQANLKAREESARDVIDRLELFAKELGDHPQFAALARPAKQIADVEAEGGREKLDAAKRAEDDARRHEELKTADVRLQQVQTRLDEFQRQFDAMSRVENDRRQLHAIAERQEDLATRAAELARNDLPQRAQIDQLQAEQGKLDRELAELTRKSPELRADALASQAKQAATLAEKARELARRQREEARLTGDPSQREAKLKALAEAQRALEDDARRLAMKLDSPLQENSHAVLNAAALAQAVPPIAQGDIAAGKQQLEGAERELERVARDLEDIQTDPRALAARLVRRQDALRNQATEAIRETVQDRNNPKPEEVDALKARLKPLIDRQEAIHKLAAAIPTPPEKQDALRHAVERTSRALENLQNAKVNETENRQNEARNALAQLEQALPNEGQRQEAIRPAIHEARNRTDHIAREIERHLRETAPQPGRPFDPERAANDLADRLAPLAKQEAEAAADLRAIPVPARLEPQRRLAAARTEALAQALADADRAALPAVADDAKAATERLLNKFQGNVPDDDRAAELAEELADLNHPDPDGPPAADSARRIASALRNLNAEDGRIAQDQAVAAAEAAAAALAQPNANAEAEVAKATKAAEALARRMTDQSAPAEQVATLAGAERTPPAANPAAEAVAQRQVGRQLARLSRDLPSDAPQIDALHEAAAAVDQAAALADRAADPNPNDGQPAPSAATVAAARDAAAGRLDALVAALGNPPERPNVADGKANPKARAEELVRDQKALAEAIQGVNKQAKDNPNPNDAKAQLADRLAPLLARQAALTDAVQAVSNPHQGRDPRRDAERRRGNAAVDAARTAEALRRRDPERAERMAREAAANIEQLAAALPDHPADGPDPTEANAPNDPALPVNDADANAAHALARRERRIREDLQAILGERIEPQNQLREETAALGRQFAALRDATRETGSRAQGPANAAAELLQNHAPREMDAGMQNLAQGQVQPARDAQRRAADHVEHAAQQAEDIAAAVLADRPTDAVGHGDPRTSDALSAARDGQRQAGQQLAEARNPGQGRQAAEAAANAMRGAAENLRSVAQAQAGRPNGESMEGEAGDEVADGQPHQGDPQGRSKDPKSAPAGTAEADLTELKALVRSKTGRSWGELPGHLRTEILQMSGGRYREEYARLIQLYFKEIAEAQSAP
jgi:hypothetical protein